MRRIRAVTFNILHGQRGDGSGVVDLEQLGRCAAGFDADLLALQEVDVGVPRSGRADQPAAVAAATGMEVVFGRAHRVRGVGKYGNALLARGPISEVEVLRLPKSAHRHEPRAAILATVHVDGSPVSVAATHLSIHRPEVHDQLATVVAALVRRPPPLVLLGDLNLLPEEVAPVVEAAGLTLVDGEPTFPAPDPRIRIDHVAIAGLTPCETKVVATPCSDHRALMVDLEQPH
ncbi:MAG: endonuclease/exonuclease/phosphatase family protein [Actinobacteria bacterium]|nr:endonuclease/exonuclease/phosphatase family protein [Actinomycetota bacterium]MBW3651022.1 endonuclease/exonuclease/phosphatase family protein [Actinomycetota bacterium]